MKLIKLKNTDGEYVYINPETVCTIEPNAVDSDNSTVRLISDVQFIIGDAKEVANKIVGYQL